MGWINRSGLAVALAVFGAAGAHAQTLGNLQWVGTGSSFASNFQTVNGSTVTTVNAYAGAAYRANASIPGTAPWYLQSSNGFGPAVDILCIDFLHTAHTTTYPAYFTNLAFDGLTRTRSANLDQYRRVAWLTTQMETLPFTSAGRQDRTEIHAAIWQIMGGTPHRARVSGGSYSGSELAIASWINLANLNYMQTNLAQFTVVTAECVWRVGNAGRGSTVPDNCSQEFLVRNTTVTPEPAALLMLASGLLLVLGASVVKRETPLLPEHG
jgi:hypothetical protein